MIKKTGVLSGIRVVEWSNTRAVRLVGMFLAEQGADVVRISEKFQYSEENNVDTILDRNKKKISLSENNQNDLNRIVELVECADVFITHFTTEKLSKHKIDADTIRSTKNAGLISCFLPGYPSYDSRSNDSWTEDEINIASGLYETPTGIGKPSYFSFPMASTYASFHAVNAITMALISRKNSVGQHIEIPILNVAITIQIAVYMVKSKPPICWSILQMLASPFMGIWKTANGEHIYLHIGISRHLRSFVMILDKIGFKDEKKILKKTLSKETRLEPSMVSGVREAIKISKIFKTLFLKQDALFWENNLSDAGLCCVKVRTVDEWLSHQQPIISREMVTILNKKNKEIKAPGLLSQVNNTGEVWEYSLGQESFYRDVLSDWQKNKCQKNNSGKIQKPLFGKRVLDFSRVIAGPYSGRLLAEYGAEVLLVTFRKSHIPWEEPMHVFFSCGKDSIIADLSSSEGRAAFSKIIEDFKPDIIIHNFSDVILKKLKLDKSSLLKTNPDILYVSISAYNTQGPWKERIGLEWNIQAASGIVEAYSGINNPQILNIPINDLCTGIIASYGVALSCYNLSNGSKGNDVSACLSTPSLFMLIDNFNSEYNFDRGVHGFYKSKDLWFLLSVDYKHINKISEISGLSGCKILTKKERDKYLIENIKKQNFAYWKEKIELSGYKNEIKIYERVKVKKILKEQLKIKNSLLKYKKHEVFGDVLIADSPVVMSKTSIANLKSAHYFGDDTKKYLHKSKVFSEALYKRLFIKKEKPVNDNFYTRTVWVLGQLKWIVAIISKKW